MEVRLYDANGMNTGSADADEEPGREGVVEHGGKVYVWNQRNAQWREAAGSVKLRGFSSVVAAESANKAPEKD